MKNTALGGHFIGRALFSAIGSVILLCTLCAGLGCPHAIAQEWRILAPAGDAKSCAGCTTGGLSCFGRNSCEAGCLTMVRFGCDTCERMEGPDPTCCPSCPVPCRPNRPCAGNGPFSLAADTCPSEGGVTRECWYYARRSRCTGNRCRYYLMESPLRCKNPPISGTPAQLSCVRQCLQARDALLGPGDRSDGGCPRLDPIIAYHKSCFVQCGYSEDDFPETLFRMFGRYDD
jgi:hypothetical protein